MSSLGIDIGGTRTKAALVESDGSLLHEWNLPTECTHQRIIASIRDILRSSPEPPVEMAIASPGLAASDNLSIAWMRGRLEVVEGLVWSDHLPMPALVLNDAHAATLGEAWIGAAAGVPNVVLLTLGTGVGGGVVINHKLFQGASGRAGHVGHMTVNFLGPADIVGMPGSLEDHVGNHSLELRSGGRFVETSELVDAVESADQDAIDLWLQSIEVLATAIASLQNLFDPNAVVIGGGIAEAGPILFTPLRVALEQVEWCPVGQSIPVVPAKLGDLAGAIGAARFAALSSEPLGVT